MIKILALTLLVTLALSRTYPLFKQCDSRWGNQQLGTSANTICKAGCTMSSASMALAGTGHNYNPSTLNAYLKSHGGYVSGDLFVWGALNNLGLTYEGKVGNSQIKAKLDQGKVVICNVHNGGHWVLAYGYSGENIAVNDPGYSTTAYAISQIVDGQNAVYGIRGGSYYNLIGKINSLRTQTEEADGGRLETVELH